jgi:hypothetical protein
VTDDDDSGVMFEFEAPFRALDIVGNYARACGDRSPSLNTVCAWLSFSTADLWDDVPESGQIAWLDEHAHCCAASLRDVLARVEASAREVAGDE